MDAAGGMYLYSTYAESINGGRENALELVAPVVAQEITISLAVIAFGV